VARLSAVPLIRVSLIDIRTLSGQGHPGQLP
jgi:hypothetical protein